MSLHSTIRWWFAQFIISAFYHFVLASPWWYISFDLIINKRQPFRFVECKLNFGLTFVLGFINGQHSIIRAWWWSKCLFSRLEPWHMWLGNLEAMRRCFVFITVYGIILIRSWQMRIPINAFLGKRNYLFIEFIAGSITWL